MPQTARIWNYWLGGKDNFAVDRQVGDEIYEAFPEIVEIARAFRAFLMRAVRYLAGEVGIRQFLDIGTGLPTANNTHEVAQSVAPESRIVYVDFDPLVLVHARALLTSSPEGATAYIDADLRDTDSILQQASQTLDLSQPVGLTLMGILGHIPDYDEAKSIVHRLMDGLPAGSYFVTRDSANTSEVSCGPPRSGTSRRTRHTTSGARSRSLASSRVWNSLSPASDRSPCGGPTPLRPRPAGRWLRRSGT